MVPFLHGPNRIQGCGASIAPERGLASDQLYRTSNNEGHRVAVTLDTKVLIQGCVKTCTSRECAELFSLFSSFDSDCQSGSFLIQRNRDKLSTRKFDVGVFTQPGSKADLTAPKSDFRFATESGLKSDITPCPFGAKRRHPFVSRSVELEHLFQESFDALFGFPGGDRIVAGVRAVNDAGVRVCEWLLGVGIHEKPVGLLLDFAIAHALESRLHHCRLRAEWVVECVRGVRIFSYFNIRACGSQPLDVCLAGSNGVIVILRTAEDADRSADNVGIGQECRHAIRVERNVSRKLSA